MLQMEFIIRSRYSTDADALRNNFSGEYSTNIYKA